MIYAEREREYHMETRVDAKTERVRIWEELLKTQDGPEMFKFAGPDCVFGPCKEGKMCCGKPFRSTQELVSTMSSTTLPRYIIDTKWPLLKEV